MSFKNIIAIDKTMNFNGYKPSPSFSLFLYNLTFIISLYSNKGNLTRRYSNLKHHRSGLKDSEVFDNIIVIDTFYSI